MWIVITNFVDSHCSVGYSSTDPSTSLLAEKIKKTAVSSSIQSAMVCPYHFSCNRWLFRILFVAGFFVRHFTATINFTFNLPVRIALHNFSTWNRVQFFLYRFSGLKTSKLRIVCFVQLQYSFRNYLSPQTSVFSISPALSKNPKCFITFVF